MNLKAIVDALALRVIAGTERLETEVTGGYTSDLLSCAMAGAAKGNVWVTLQGHLNVVAVASLNELAAVIVTEGKPIAAETAGKAEEEGVVLLQTPLTSYQVVGRLWDSGREYGSQRHEEPRFRVTMKPSGLSSFDLWTRRLMPTIYADLHLHTVHSACAEVEMIPPLIVRRALELGLNLLAVTDHNAAANCAAVIAAAEGTGLVVLPGMEVQTAEEVHMLCLFETVEQALTWQGTVFDHLPDLRNDEDRFGGQYVVDRDGDYVRTEGRLLATSTDLSVEEAARRVLALGGLPIPAHIDRSMFSLFANLGFVPPGLPVPALEIFRLTDPAHLLAAAPRNRPLPPRPRQRRPPVERHAPVPRVRGQRPKLPSTRPGHRCEPDYAPRKVIRASSRPSAAPVIRFSVSAGGHPLRRRSSVAPRHRCLALNPSLMTRVILVRPLVCYTAQLATWDISHTDDATYD